MLYGRLSITPTTSTSVDLFVFIFFLLELQFTKPYPNYILMPVWLFRSGCTPYAASTYVNNWLRLSAPTIVLSSIVCFRYCNTRLNLALSSLVLLVTLVHRNDISGSTSGLPLFANQSRFANIQCRISASLFSILVELLSIFCKTFFAVDDTVALRSS